MANSSAGLEMGSPSDNLGPMALRVEFIMAGIAIPVLLARLCARLKHQGRLRLDDYLMTLSLAFGLVGAGLLPVAVDAGLGRHAYYLEPDQVKQAVKNRYIATPFSFLALVLGRVSFAVTLLAWIGTVKWRRWVLYFVIVSQVIIHMFVVSVLIFICHPIRKFWDREVPGTCLGSRWLEGPSYTLTGLNIFADLVLALMPALVIPQLNLQKKVKAMLIFLMGLGVFIVIAVIIAMVESLNASAFKDPTYERIIPNLWGKVQVYLVVIVASIPLLRPLFVGNKAFSISFYRSFLGNSSLKLRYQSGDSNDALWDKGGKSFESLPHVEKHRFVTTTLRKAGIQTETGFNVVRTNEEGPSSKY